MQAADEAVIDALCTWLRNGTCAWFCTIVRTYGSSPRPVGSVMAVSDSGAVCGSLSGGCVEENLLEKLAAGGFAGAAPELLRYGLAPEDTEKLGLPCGGHLHVLLERVTPAALEHFTGIDAALKARRAVDRHLDLNSGTLQLCDAARPTPLTLDAAGILRHGYGPAYQLFLIGAGMVSRYLADMAQALHFQVTVCDPRPAMLEQWHVPGTRTLAMMPDDAVRAHAQDPHTAIIALTHDPRIDDMGLMEALTGPAFYVGAMGSTRTNAARRERLALLDLSEAQIARLRGPVGLPIGSKTPAEIAVAIIAELVQETARRRGESLDEPAAGKEALNAG